MLKKYFDFKTSVMTFFIVYCLLNIFVLYSLRPEISTLNYDELIYVYSSYIINILFSLFFVFFSDKSKMFDKEYSVSRKVFNLLITLYSYSFISYIFSIVLYYLIFKVFLIEDFLYILLSILPVIIIANYITNSTDYFSIDNSKNINIINFWSLFFIIECYSSVITSIINLLFRIDVDTSLLSLVLSLLFLFVILLINKLIHDKIIKVQ